MDYDPRLSTHYKLVDWLGGDDAPAPKIEATCPADSGVEHDPNRNLLGGCVAGILTAGVGECVYAYLPHKEVPHYSWTGLVATDAGFGLAGALIAYAITKRMDRWRRER